MHVDHPARHRALVKVSGNLSDARTVTALLLRDGVALARRASVGAIARTAGAIAVR